MVTCDILIYKHMKETLEVVQTILFLNASRQADNMPPFSGKTAVRNSKNIATIRDFHLPSSFFCLSTRLQTLPRIVCQRYKPCEFLGFIWTDCWGNKSNYVITSPANSTALQFLKAEKKSYFLIFRDKLVGDSPLLILLTERAYFLRNCEKNDTLNQLAVYISMPNMLFLSHLP